jgi:hypothetical protein
LQVVSVRWTDWARLKGSAAQQQHLWDALAAAPQAPGIFAASDAAPGRSSAGGSNSSGGAPEGAAQSVRRMASQWWRLLLEGGGG